MLPPCARFATRRARSTLVLLVASSIVAALVPTPPASAEPTVGSDQRSIAQLEQQIASEGAKAEALVQKYNEAQARLDAINLQITRDQRVLAAEQRTQAQQRRAMQILAIQAYTSNRGTDATLSMFASTSSVQAVQEQNHYLDTVNAQMYDRITALEMLDAEVRDSEQTLQSEQAQAKQTVVELTAAHDAATEAIAAGEAQLGHVKGNLRVLLAAATAQREAEQAATERALAAAARTATNDPAPPTSTAPTPTQGEQPSSPPSPPPRPPTPVGGSSGYANPFRGVLALTPERIDQGVDFATSGPVYAIGDGVVLCTFGPGWPTGTFIAYRLTDGPASGLVVYVAEDLEPNVQVGQTVSSGTVIGQAYLGPNGIEIGWADGTALPDTMARRYGQYDGASATAFGANFSRFLLSLGAPGGTPNGTPSGSLPAGWPEW